jgi:crotonobetainyl-CoA:carnitine CoA-transferase CaiB-like acyl-CoA transferase
VLNGRARQHLFRAVGSRRCELHRRTRCGDVLSDFGAEVVKVEPPTGDPWRNGHKLPPQPQAEDPYQWHLANRNKRGITLDLKAPSARPVLQRLVKWADVLIVNTPHARN